MVRWEGVDEVKKIKERIKSESELVTKTQFLCQLKPEKWVNV